MTSSTSKLIYFGIQARAESTRMVLAHAKADYVDERISKEEFAVRKEAGEFPNGQVPVWIQNGKQYNESLAILRLVGRQFGYYPAEHIDAWACDSIVDYSNDYIVKLVKPVFFEKRLDESGQKDYSDNLRAFVTYLSKRLEHGKDFLVGDKLTIADFHVVSILFAHIYNDSYIGGAAFTDKGKAIVAEN